MKQALDPLHSSSLSPSSLCPSSPCPSSPSDFMATRIIGRIRSMLDYTRSDSAIVPSMVGDVLIAHDRSRKNYRVALLRKSRKKMSPHDYLISTSSLAAVSHDHIMLIDGLVSAAMKSVTDLRGTGRRLRTSVRGFLRSARTPFL